MTNEERSRGNSPAEDLGPGRWSLRVAGAADLETLVAIERQAAGRWCRKVFQSEFAATMSTIWLLMENSINVPVGFMVAWQVVDEMQLHNVVVKPSHRRCGAGRYLISFLLREARARDLRRITLEVRSANHGAQQLYRELDFYSVGVRQAYYADTGESAILMEKQLCYV